MVFQGWNLSQNYSRDLSRYKCILSRHDLTQHVTT